MALDVYRAVAGVLFAGSIGWLATTGATGCSSSSAAPPQAEAGTVCPATIDGTVGVACNTEGLVCSPTFPCGFATVTIRCTCSLGAFQCVDGSGNQFSAGQTPSCGDAGGNLPSCPANEATANGAKCSAAQSGQQCAYPPKCSGGTLAYDLCTCESDPNQSGFTFDCQNSCAGGTGPVPESGTSSSGGDDASDDASDGSSGDDGATHD